MTSRLTGRMKMFAPTTASTPTAASTYSPAPAREPIAAAHQSVAAVLRPRMLSPSRRITPAPRNPMPETTWAATRVGSAVTPSKP